MPNTVYGGPPGGATGLGLLIFGVEIYDGSGAPETLRAGDQAQLVVKAEDSELPNVAQIISDVLNSLPDPYENTIESEELWDDRKFESVVVEVLQDAGYDSVWKHAMTWVIHMDC